jgi:toxin-antitoxin system PIN domain toxin
VFGLIDTNVLLYGANADAAEYGASRAFLIGAGNTRESWYVTDGTLYEFLRVATHAKVFPRPLGWREALSFLQPFVAADNVHIVGVGESHWSLLGDLLAELAHPSGNLFIDVRTVVLMREHGIRRIYTTDTDLLQFAGIEVVNPLRSWSAGTALRLAPAGRDGRAYGRGDSPARRRALRRSSRSACRTEDTSRRQSAEREVMPSSPAVRRTGYTAVMRTSQGQSKSSGKGTLIAIMTWASVADHG